MRMSLESNKDIAERCNGLARLFHRSKGFNVPDDCDMSESRHHDEIHSWNLAVTAFEYICGFDVQEALEDLEGHQ